MTGRDVVIAKTEVLLEVALAYVVRVDADRGLAAEGPIQPFRAHAAEHLLEVAGVDAVILLVGETAEMRRLQVRHGEPRRRQVLAQESPHARQVARSRRMKAIVVVDQAQPELRPYPRVFADPEAHSLRGPNVVTTER